MDYCLKYKYNIFIVIVDSVSSSESWRFNRPTSEPRELWCLVFKQPKRW